MNKDGYNQDRRWGCLGIMVYVITVVTALILLCSCSRRVYVPVETVRTESHDADTTTIYRHLRSLFESMLQREIAKDSIVDRSKETLVLKENGDTARHDKERIIYISSHREKELEHKLSQMDSIIDMLRFQLATIKADTIPVPYPVERQLSIWESTKQEVGGIAIGAIVIAICIAVIWLIRKFRK